MAMTEGTKRLTIKLPPRPRPISSDLPFGIPDNSGLWHEEDDEQIVIRAGMILFRVNRKVLWHESSVFRRAIRTLPLDLSGSGSNICPWIEVDDSSYDMGLLLHSLYDRSYVPTDIDQMLLVLRMCLKYWFRDWSRVHKRIYEFLRAVYPSTLRTFDLAQVHRTVCPHYAVRYWLRSDVCFRLANEVNAVRWAGLGRAEQVNKMWTGLVLYCSMLPWQDIKNGVVDANGRRWVLDLDIQELIQTQIRQQLHELAIAVTYRFSWEMKCHPRRIHAIGKKEPIGIRKLPKRSNTSTTPDWQSCESFRANIWRKIVQKKGPEYDFLNPFWIPYSVWSGESLTDSEELVCCPQCRTVWLEHIIQGRKAVWKGMKRKLMTHGMDDVDAMDGYQ